MTYRLMSYGNVEALISDDPIGRLLTDVDRAASAYEAAHREEAEVALTLSRMIGKKFNEDQKFRELLGKIDLRTAEERYELASILDVSVLDVECFVRYRTDCAAAMEAVAPAQELNDEWHRLKVDVGIKDTDASVFASKLERPMLVLFSADWCPPCRMKRPAFAELVRFFYEADVYYCDASERFELENIETIPTIVVYFPRGVSVRTSLRDTVAKVWEDMHLLVALGNKWEGTGAGELIHEDCSPLIVPYEAA